MLAVTVVTAVLSINQCIKKSYIFGNFFAVYFDEIVYGFGDIVQKVCIVLRNVLEHLIADNLKKD